MKKGFLKKYIQNSPIKTKDEAEISDKTEAKGKFRLYTYVPFLLGRQDQSHLLESSDKPFAQLLLLGCKVRLPGRKLRARKSAKVFPQIWSLWRRIKGRGQIKSVL